MMTTVMMTSQCICLCLVLISRIVTTGSLGKRNEGLNPGLEVVHGHHGDTGPSRDGVQQGGVISPVAIPHQITEQKIATHSSDHADYTHDFRVLIDSPEVCKNQVFLLVFVCSSVENFKQREAIRQTWGSIEDPTIKIIFVLGSVNSDDPKWNQITNGVKNESIIHRDIIQEDFIDSYKNLTIKSITWIKWTAFKCKHAKYILKSDDDMFINLPSLLSDLKNTVHKRFIMGNIIAGAQPSQDKESKYFTPKTLYDKALYPKYMSGSAYVVSGDLIYDLYLATKRTAPFWIEDIYITGLLAEKLDMQHIFNGKFVYKRRILHPCLFNYVITGHYMTPPEMIKLWLKIKHVDYPCEKTRLSHGNMDGTW